jgi:hypothetical protein
MAVFVFADDGFAARCARAGIYTSEHQPVDPHAAALGRRSKTFPYKLIAATTVETHMHRVNAPGAVFPSDGQYETYLASGRAFAIWLAYTDTTPGSSKGIWPGSPPRSAGSRLGGALLTWPIAGHVSAQR